MITDRLEILGMSGVGTKLVFEDEKIKMWEFILEPGEEIPIHTHEMDYMFYVIEGSTLQVFDINHNDLGRVSLVPGDTLAFRLKNGELIGRDDPEDRSPITHSAKNVGSTRYREILVETK